jgi:hypothetical protein
MYPNSLVLEACSCFTPVTTQITTQTSTTTPALRELVVPTTTTTSSITTTITTSTITSTIADLSFFSRVYGPSSCSPVPDVAVVGVEVAFSATFFTTPYPSALSACASTCGQEIDCYMFYFYGTSSTYTCTGFFPWFSPLMSSYAIEYVADATPGTQCTYTEDQVWNYVRLISGKSDLT